MVRFDRLTRVSAAVAALALAARGSPAAARRRAWKRSASAGTSRSASSWATCTRMAAGCRATSAARRAPTTRACDGRSRGRLQHARGNRRADGRRRGRVDARRAAVPEGLRGRQFAGMPEPGPRRRRRATTWCGRSRSTRSRATADGPPGATRWPSAYQEGEGVAKDIIKVGRVLHAGVRRRVHRELHGGGRTSTPPARWSPRTSTPPCGSTARPCSSTPRRARPATKRLHRERQAAHAHAPCCRQASRPPTPVPPPASSNAGRQIARPPSRTIADESQIQKLEPDREVDPQRRRPRAEADVEADLEQARDEESADAGARLEADPDSVWPWSHTVPVSAKTLMPALREVPSPTSAGIRNSADAGQPGCRRRNSRPRSRAGWRPRRAGCARSPAGCRRRRRTAPAPRAPTARPAPRYAARLRLEAVDRRRLRRVEPLPPGGREDGVSREDRVHPRVERHVRRRR